jgi:F-type H+-transporting ATPase subunit epsilon
VSKFRLEVVTAERTVFSGSVDCVVAWCAEGQVSVLAHHAPMMALRRPGDLVIRRDGQEEYLAVGGGFLEVRPDRVVVLAETCERAEEIDIGRAEEARRRAQQDLSREEGGAGASAAAEAALRRSLARLKVARRFRSRRRSL